MKAAKETAVLAGFVLMFVLFYGGSDLALTALRKLGSTTARTVRRGVDSSPFTNPALAVKEGDAELPLGVCSLKLGDLVRMLNTMDSSLEVRSFYASFMAKPSLSAALKQYAKDRDGRTFQRKLVHDREFAALFELYSRSDRFQYRLAMLNQPSQSAAARSAPAPAPARASSPIVFRAEPAAEHGHPAAGPALAEPDGAPESVYRSGPDYDGQPQPGLAGVDEAPALLTLNTAAPSMPPGGLVTGPQQPSSVSSPASGVLQDSSAPNTRVILLAPAGGQSSAAPAAGAGGSSSSGGSTPCWPPGHCKNR